jgi:SLOG cluster2
LASKLTSSGARSSAYQTRSPDLARLGLLEIHFRLALGEIARCVLVSGGNLSYGGHLHPDGYTTFLMQELHRYSRRDRPLHIYLAWQEHRELSLSQLKEQQEALGLYGRIFCLDPVGNVIDPYQNRPEEPVPESDTAVCKQSLTALRRYMAGHTQGRIFIGSRRKGFQGDLPGIAEEALISLDAGQPIYLAGGFGGVTVDILQALGVDDGSWLPQDPDMASPDERLVRGIGMLADIRSRDDWAGLQNGLSDEENRKLAAAHRPSEIAALISLGLGRRFMTT